MKRPENGAFLELGGLRYGDSYPCSKQAETTPDRLIMECSQVSMRKALRH